MITLVFGFTKLNTTLKVASTSSEIRITLYESRLYFVDGKRFVQPKCFFALLLLDSFTVSLWRYILLVKVGK